MNILSILQIIAALATTAVGLIAFINPAAAYGFTGLIANGPRGVSEIRSVLGGLFIGLGVLPFVLGKPAYRMLGIGYLAIALARVISILIDKSYDQSNWISLGSELVLGIVLIL